MVGVVGMRLRREVIRRLANVKIKQCYLDVFKYLVDNNIDYSVNKNGVFFLHRNGNGYQTTQYSILIYI